MRWTDQGAGGVLAVPMHSERVRALALHILLLDGVTWAYWQTARGDWLGLVPVGQA